MFIIKLLILLLAYLIGSIPFGLLLGFTKGVDIRKEGSKNIGATNTGRVLGFKYSVYTYILDMFKGFIFVFLFRFKIIPEEYMILDPSLYGLAAVLGHSFSIYLGFKGGKAVSTGGGMVFGYCPWLIIFALPIFFITLKISKTVSIGSLVAASFMFIASLVLYFLKFDFIFTSLSQVTIYFPIVCLITVIIIFIKHRANIQRIKNHTEPHIK